MADDSGPQRTEPPFKLREMITAHAPQEIWELSVSTLTTKLCESFDQQKNCDMTVILGDFKFGAHSVIFSQSDVFEASLNGPFKEGQTRSIDLTSDGEVAARNLIHFLYSSSYEATIVDGPKSELLSHVTMWQVGDKYNLVTLRNAAHKNIELLLAMPSSTWQLLNLVAPVYEVTTSTNRGPRDILLQHLKNEHIIIVTHLKVQLRECLQKVPEFAHELALALMEGMIRPANPPVDGWGFQNNPADPF